MEFSQIASFVTPGVSQIPEVANRVVKRELFTLNPLSFTLRFVKA
jgi:hypothetical protein